MLSWLTQLFRRDRAGSRPNPGPVHDDDAEWRLAPDDPLDVAGWDHYWARQVAHGVGPDVIDTSVDDRDLVETMRREKLKSVLCAGSGISQEPRALAAAGFHVVALDFSSQAIEIARSAAFPPDALERFCGAGMRREGGHVEFVVGDFLDPAVCPGPFDVIIERSTAQLFVDHDIGTVLGALAKRLAPNGIFLSHSHDARWKPPAAPHHFTASWFQENQWTIWGGWPGRKPPGQVAWLYPETG
jgi:2-polyprenyl-3-methyl-5-hydroxy-6-metoxy-1,4-benzoquinol methylase